jgi:hypothetical protein
MFIFNINLTFVKYYYSFKEPCKHDKYTAYELIGEINYSYINLEPLMDT